MRLSVIGRSPVFSGLCAAADLSLAGHAVRYAPWSGDEALLDDLAQGLTLRDPDGVAISGQTGPAPVAVLARMKDSVAGADLVILDVPAPAFEARFAELLPHLDPGQTVLINMHGYWPGLRLAPLLRAAGREDITLAETAAPAHGGSYGNGVVTLQCLRHRVPVGVFPADRTEKAMALIGAAFPNLVSASNVIETGLASLNMLIHFPLSLINVGWSDRMEQAGQAIPLYQHGMTAHGSALSAALDAERAAVCAAFGVGYRSLPGHLADYYGAAGDTAQAAVAATRYYQELPPYDAGAWRRWMLSDIPYAYVPFVRFAEVAGVPVPLHRAAIALASAMLSRDFDAEGPTLETLGLAGLDVAGIGAMVRHGPAAA